MALLLPSSAFAQDRCGRRAAERAEVLVRRSARRRPRAQSRLVRLAELEKAVAAGDDKTLTDASSPMPATFRPAACNANRVDKEIDIRQRKARAPTC
jgi:hypothetical protein